MMDNGLDILIRLPDTAELTRLNHCVFSILGQALPGTSLQARLGVPVRLHLMLQRFSFIQMRAVRLELQDLMLIDQGTTVTLHNWDYADPFELDVPLLNWGLEVTAGRYLTCLNVDHALFPGAYPRLLGRLQATGAALALGGVMSREARWWGDVILPQVSARQSSPVPDAEISSPLFLLDRTRLLSQHLVFQVGAPGREVADFVDGLTARYPTDTTWLAHLLAIRQRAG